MKISYTLKQRDPKEGQGYECASEEPPIRCRRESAGLALHAWKRGVLQHLSQRNAIPDALFLVPRPPAVEPAGGPDSEAEETQRTGEPAKKVRRKRGRKS